MRYIARIATKQRMYFQFSILIWALSTNIKTYAWRNKTDMHCKQKIILNVFQTENVYCIPVQDEYVVSCKYAVQVHWKEHMRFGFLKYDSFPLAAQQQSVTRPHWKRWFTPKTPNYRKAKFYHTIVYIQYALHNII